MIETAKDRIARGASRYSLNNSRLVNVEFKEADHPRGGDGKFGSGGGGEKGGDKEKKAPMKELSEIPTDPKAKKAPDGTKASWSPEGGGLLFHGTNAPAGTEYLEGDADGVIYLTDDFGEAEQYAHGVHMGGSQAKDTKRVLYIGATGGKMLSVDDEINKLVEDGEDDLSSVFDKAREQGAEFVYFSHPANYDGEKAQNVIVALNPGDTLGPAKSGWDLEKKTKFRGKVSNSVKVYRARK